MIIAFCFDGDKLNYAELEWNATSDSTVIKNSDFQETKSVERLGFTKRLFKFRYLHMSSAADVQLKRN